MEYSYFGDQLERIDEEVHNEVRVDEFIQDFIDQQKFLNQITNVPFYAEKPKDVSLLLAFLLKAVAKYQKEYMRKTLIKLKDRGLI